MSELQSQGGCFHHGPFEVCGHTTETCPNNPENAQAIDSDETVVEENADVVSETMTSPETANNQELIGSAKSFDELIDTIQTNNVQLEGTEQKYPPELLVDVVEKVRTREIGIEYVTRTDGLRDKVRELLQTDSSVDELRQVLDDVEDKLMTEPYLHGYSTDHPANQRRDERLKWKERLRRDISNLQAQAQD